MHPFRGFTFHKPSQQLLADFRQDCVSQNRINCPGSTFNFSAAAGNKINGLVVLSKRYFVIFLRPAADSAKLQANNKF